MFVFTNMSRPSINTENGLESVLNSITVDSSVSIPNLNTRLDTFSESTNDNLIEQIQDKQGKSHNVYFDQQTGLYKIENNSYVYIKGNYYPYNPRNVYSVNGVKYIFKPQPTKVKNQKNTNALSGGFKNSNFQMKPEMGGAFNANNIHNVMDNLKKAQSNIQQRNKALD
ncbi:MAG: hypothetical protein KDD40_11365, partial [Bdellovibrionales bacterium]|nr:hypothetical protein [Bdellovibrionales bacterium]